MSGAARKSKIRRVERVEPALVVPPGPARLRRLRVARLRRIGVPVALCAAALALVVPLFLWVLFRTTHVVSRNSSVKGSITSLGAQLEGVVTSVEVDAGQQVRAGQVLVRFEDHQLQAAVQRAQSRLDKATRELEVERLAIGQERKRMASRVTEAQARVAAAAAQVEAADAQATDARLRHELRKSMAQGVIITQEELRTAEATRRSADALDATARADRKAAQAAQQVAQVETEGLDVREQHLVVLESEVAALRAERSLAEADLDAALIRAPADGWVVRRIAEPGASVVVGQPLVALWIGHDVWVEAWIDESDLAKVGVGNPARVTVKSYPGRAFTGVVETIGVATDYELPDTAVPQSRTERMRATPVVCVRIRLQNSEGLFPGLSAEAGIRKKQS